MTKTGIVCLLLLGTAATALAETPQLTLRQPSEATWSLGARIGGYGFRRPHTEGRTEWNQCRMNGLGLFANRALRGPFFVEAGLDMYASDNFVMPGEASDLPVDRQSVLTSVAAGVKVPLTKRITSYAQLGAGLELTKVAVPYGNGDIKVRDQQALPIGFIGVGGDLRIGKNYFGANLRVHAMGNFDYDPKRLEMSGNWPVPPSADAVFDPSPQLAAQGQFYLRRDL